VLNGQHRIAHRRLLQCEPKAFRGVTVSPMPADWDELVQARDDRDVFQASPDELPVIDIHSL